jgi:predicted enzyme related to lactoylglutathione lyase
MPRVIHFEIHAGDPDRAIRFYQAVFGWSFQRWDPVEYWLITTGPDTEPGINGGLTRRKGAIDGQCVIAYVCTVDVASLEETIQKVEANAGTVVVPKMAIPGIGWLVYCKDPEGNIFGAMQSDPKAA